MGWRLRGIQAAIHTGCYWLLICLCTVVGNAFAEITVPDNPDYAWRAPLASKSLLLSIDKSSGRVMAVGERGHILKLTADSQWQQADVPSQALLTAIAAQENNLAWAVGHDALILFSADGGKHWLIQHEAAELQQPLLDVYFMSSSQGIAVGAYGLYLHTADGGDNWQSKLVNEEHDFHLNAITASAEGDIYIAAEAGHVYRSTDQGTSWQVLKPDYDGSFFAIASLMDNSLIVAGLRGHVFISQDSGENWQAIATGTRTSLNAVAQLDNGQIVIVGHAGTLLLMDADYKQVHQYQFNDRKALSDVIETETNRLILVGEAGVQSVDLCKIFRQGQVKGCGRTQP